jgi:hypothetical protein
MYIKPATGTHNTLMKWSTCHEPQVLAMLVTKMFKRKINNPQQAAR